MGDRHGGRFARRGRALNPPRPQVDAHRGVGFRWRATVFRWRGVVGRICPAQKRSPRRRPPDTAHERKDLPRAGTRPTAKASRHGAKAKEFAPTREGSPRRKPPDTAHEQKNLPRAGTLSSAKASRHGTKAKGFAPRRNTPLGEGLHTAHERKDLPHARTLPSAKASRHSARAKGFAPRGSPSPHVPTNGGPPSIHRQPKNTPSAGSHPQRAAAAEFIHQKK